MSEPTQGPHIMSTKLKVFASYCQSIHVPGALEEHGAIIKLAYIDEVGAIAQHSLVPLMVHRSPSISKMVLF